VASQPVDLVSLEQFSPAAVRSLLEPQAAPCLSVYLPTHRNVPDNTVDLPAFRHLVEALEMALSATQSRETIELLLRPLRILADDARFWNHTRDGLAVLAAAGRARVFVLERPVRPLALVTSRFHTLPLVRIAAALERFLLLALTSREARLFAGAAWHGTTGDTMGPLEPLPLVGRPGRPPDTRLERADVVDEETFQPHRVQRGMGIEGIVHGGTGSKQEDIADDTEIFLRHVDAVVRGQVAERAELPLVLVAAARLAAVFHRLSTNPHLLAEHAATDPHLLSAAELAAAVQPILVAARQRRIARAVAAYDQARHRDQAAGDPGPRSPAGSRCSSWKPTGSSRGGSTERRGRSKPTARAGPIRPDAAARRRSPPPTCSAAWRRRCSSTGGRSWHWPETRCRRSRAWRRSIDGDARGDRSRSTLQRS